MQEAVVLAEGYADAWKKKGQETVEEEDRGRARGENGPGTPSHEDFRTNGQQAPEATEKGKHNQGREQKGDLAGETEGTREKQAEYGETPTTSRNKPLHLGKEEG